MVVLTKIHIFNYSRLLQTIDGC